jgi:hypothetical protein
MSYWEQIINIQTYHDSSGVHVRVTLATSSDSLPTKELLYAGISR